MPISYSAFKTYAIFGISSTSVQYAVELICALTHVSSGTHACQKLSQKSYPNLTQIINSVEKCHSS